MNWYKEIKVALPVMERRPGYEYTSVGHDYFDEYGVIREELWLIDKDWNLLTVKFGGRKITEHSDAFPGKWAGAKAKGRYEEKKGGKKRVSLVVIQQNMQYYDPKKNQYIIEKASKILDKHYGNPDIILF